MYGTDCSNSYWVIIVGIWLIWAIICAVIASNKGRSGVGWFFLGFLLGLIGVIIIACLSPINDGNNVNQPSHSNDKILCNNCYRDVDRSMRFCPYCGKELKQVDYTTTNTESVNSTNNIYNIVRERNYSEIEGNIIYFTNGDSINCTYIDNIVCENNCIFFSCLSSNYKVICSSSEQANEVLNRLLKLKDQYPY